MRLMGAGSELIAMHRLGHQDLADWAEQLLSGSCMRHFQLVYVVSQLCAADGGSSCGLPAGCRLPAVYDGSTQGGGCGAPGCSCCSGGDLDASYSTDVAGFWWIQGCAGRHSILPQPAGRPLRALCMRLAGAAAASCEQARAETQKLAERQQPRQTSRQRATRRDAHSVSGKETRAAGLPRLQKRYTPDAAALLGLEAHLCAAVLPNSPKEAPAYPEPEASEDDRPPEPSEEARSQRPAVLAADASSADAETRAGKAAGSAASSSLQGCQGGAAEGGTALVRSAPVGWWLSAIRAVHDFLEFGDPAALKSGSGSVSSLLQLLTEACIAACSLPAEPPPQLAEPLAAGYVPALERLLRRVGADPSANGNTISCVLLKTFHSWDATLPLLAYSEPRAAAALVLTVGKVLRRMAQHLESKSPLQDPHALACTIPHTLQFLIESTFMEGAPQQLSCARCHGRRPHSLQAHGSNARGPALPDRMQREGDGGSESEPAACSGGQADRTLAREGKAALGKESCDCCHAGADACAAAGPLACRHRRASALVSLAAAQWLPALSHIATHVRTEQWDRSWGHSLEAAFARAVLLWLVPVADASLASTAASPAAPGDAPSSSAAANGAGTKRVPAPAPSWRRLLLRDFNALGLLRSVLEAVSDPAEACPGCTLLSLEALDRLAVALPDEVRAALVDQQPPAAAVLDAGPAASAAASGADATEAGQPHAATARAQRGMLWLLQEALTVSEADVDEESRCKLMRLQAICDGEGISDEELCACTPGPELAPQQSRGSGGARQAGASAASSPTNGCEHHDDQKLACSSGEEHLVAGSCCKVVLMTPCEAMSVLGVQPCSFPGCINLEGHSESQLHMRQCGACGAHYCSRDCQTTHWRQGHKQDCGRIHGDE